MRLRFADVTSFILEVGHPRARLIMVDVGVWLPAPRAQRWVVGVEARARHGPSAHDCIKGSYLRVGSPFAQDVLGTSNGLEVGRALLEAAS